MTDALRMDHAVHDFGPRPKRIKTEAIRFGNKSPTSYTTPYPHNGDGHTLIHTNGTALDVTRVPETPFANITPPHPHLEHFQYPYPGTFGPPLPGTLSQAGYSPTSNGVTMPPIRTAVHYRAPTVEHHGPPPPSQLAPSSYRPDFSTAPRQPIPLLLWLIQEIGKIHASKMNHNYQAVHPNLPQPYSMPPITYHEPDPSLEKERQRVENRGRKQRWRQDNPERNKDNDLRCRVNKLAKIKYGNVDSPAKEAFIESEFNLRRAKREQRNKKNASQSGTLQPFSSTAEGLGTSLQNVLQTNNDPGVREAVNQLMGMLFDLQLQAGQPQPQYGSQSVPSQSIKMAMDLITQLESGTARLDNLATAMDLLAQDSEFVKSLFAGLGARNLLNGLDYMGPIAAPYTARPAPEPGYGVAGSSMSREVSSEYGQTTPLAPSLLSSLAEPKTYDSPYGRRSPSKATPTSPDGDNGKGKAAVRNSDVQNDRTNGANKSKIIDADALLELANGGNFLDDDDDDDERTIADPDDLEEHSEHAGIRDTQMVEADDVVEEDVEDVRRRYAETTVNTIVPVAKAHAASRMGQLAHHSTTKGGENNSRSTKDPQGISKSTLSEYEEEQRKVKIYGFPPLPTLHRAKT